jgi:hypothetical protein
MRNLVLAYCSGGLLSYGCADIEHRSVDAVFVAGPQTRKAVRFVNFPKRSAS